MKRDDRYFAEEDVAFNAWLDARKQHFDPTTKVDVSTLFDLARSAFLSGTGFGIREAEKQMRETIAENAVRSPREL